MHAAEGVPVFFVIPACLQQAGAGSPTGMQGVRRAQPSRGRTASETGRRGRPEPPAKTWTALRRHSSEGWNPVVEASHSRFAGMTTTGRPCNPISVKFSSHALTSRLRFLDSSLRWNDDGGCGWVCCHPDSPFPCLTAAPRPHLWTRLQGCRAFGEISRAVVEQHQKQAAEDARSRPPRPGPPSAVIPAKAGIQWLRPAIPALRE